MRVLLNILKHLKSHINMKGFASACGKATRQLAWHVCAACCVYFGFMSADLLCCFATCLPPILLHHSALDYLHLLELILSFIDLLLIAFQKLPHQISISLETFFVGIKFQISAKLNR